MRYLLILLLTISLSACEPSSVVPESTNKVDVASNTLLAEKSPDPANLLRQAEAAFSEAKAAGNVWTVAADRLQDARKAHANGNAEATIANANETIKLTELSQAQADGEVGSWQQRVPH